MGGFRGLNEADGEWVGFIDGDDQIASADTVRFLQPVSADWDMLKIRRTKRHDGFIRSSISRLYIIYFCLLFGISS